MTKAIKILSISLIIFSMILSFYSVYASDIDMNLTSNETTTEIPDTNTIQDENDQNVESDTVLPDTDNNSDSIAQPHSVNGIVEEGLSFSNILSILLITIGLILILLSIAIFIRLK